MQKKDTKKIRKPDSLDYNATGSVDPSASFPVIEKEIDATSVAEKHLNKTSVPEPPPKKPPVVEKKQPPVTMPKITAVQFVQARNIRKEQAAGFLLWAKKTFGIGSKRTILEWNAELDVFKSIIVGKSTAIK